MALLDLWKSRSSDLETKTVQQIIGIAGKGKLQDGSECSHEFRQLLSHVPSTILRRFAEDCLSSKFEDNGLALQDVVNQVGVRLGFKVTDGMYRGRQGKIGNDGLWQDTGRYSIIVEVKTTDAYRIDLNTIAKYRLELEAENAVVAGKSSILIVVGRQDTGDLEAQIRGSKHGWDIRLVSVDALFRLLRVKEETDDPKTHRRIAEVLRPQEFTRVDGIVDLLFAAAEDVQVFEEAQSPTAEREPGTRNRNGGKQPKFNPASFHEACAAKIEPVLGTKLVKHSRSAYSSPTEDVLCNISVSKEYAESGPTGYWFAFHPHQAERLREASKSFVAFGCGSADRIVLIPFKEFEPWLEGMNQTELEGRFYWHIIIQFDKDEHLVMRRKQGFERIDVTKYLLRSK